MDRTSIHMFANVYLTSIGISLTRSSGVSRTRFESHDCSSIVLIRGLDTNTRNPGCSFPPWFNRVWDNLVTGIGNSLVVEQADASLHDHRVTETEEK